jgi:TolB-like protein
VTPPADEVRAELERILASETFANAGRASGLLKYIVERTLAGESEQLKEYVLGMEVFERPASYDPRIDSIVRVEARRLRAKLDDYYQGPGAGDPVVISVVRGSYVPLFNHAVAATPALPAAKPGKSLLLFVPSTPRRRWVTAGAIVVIAALVLFTGLRLLTSRMGSEASSGIRVAVLPFAHFSSEPEVALVAARITDGVTSNLARARELSVVSRTSAAQFKSEQRPIREVAAALNAELVMEGSVVVEAGGVHVVTRLVDSAIDRKVWVKEYDSPPDQIADLNRRIAAEAAATVINIRARRP